MTDERTQADEPHFLLAMRRLANSLGYGADASPFVGSGVDYAQSRPYTPGDATRLIDWRVTARTGKPFVKEHEAHKRMPLYLLVDSSASMWASSTGQSKFDWAVRLAGALALSGLDHLNPVAMFGCESRGVAAESMRFRPSLSLRQTLGWLHRLHAMPGPTSRSAGLSTALRDVSVEAKERNIVVVLSDLYEPGLVASVRRVAQRDDVIVLRLRDPAEDGYTGGGIFRAVEAETSAGFVTTGRQTWSAGTAVMTELRRASIDAITLRTDRPFLPELRQFLQNRNLARSGR